MNYVLSGRLQGGRPVPGNRYTVLDRQLDPGLHGVGQETNINKEIHK